ncbi:MAG TPA: TetR/AcrR family transcriptional regulator [Rhizomicrobium sp.]|nr:TetR/AcrR family transcriptional regulator [Rhizomicrobium sp.]
MTDSVIIAESPRGRRKLDSLARLKQAARKLFVERGYDATRPQDIAREAGLGHGTFYLHYPDKRACFMAFVEEARSELDVYLRARRAPGQTLEQLIAATLHAIYDYSDNNPGVLRAAMTDESVLNAEGVEARPLLMRWGSEWAEMLRDVAAAGGVSTVYDAEIIGQAIVGALHQTSREAHRSGRNRTAVVANLTCFLTRALRPD